MKLVLRYFAVLSVVFVGLSVSSCKEKNPLDAFTEVKGTYFSINQYIIDEWTSHAGEPLVFKKSVKSNGKTDTTLINADNLDWPSVLDLFVATDISNRKYLGQYTFSQFDDETDKSHNFMYVANKGDMFVQKLLITMNFDMKVRGVYIETFKKTLFKETQQKMLYAPLKTIQIQQYEKPFIGATREVITKYEVLR